MAIIAILMLLGVAGLLAVRDQYVLDQVSEETITMVRDIQNRAISIQKDSSGEEGKVWGILINNNTVQALSVNAATETTLQGTPYNLPYGASISGGPLYIYFAAPFGSATVSQTSCSWTDSTKLSKELQIRTGSCAKLNSARELTLTYKNQSSRLTVAPNGDIYAN